MSDATKSGVAFSYNGTAETKADLLMLVEHCSELPLRSKSEIAVEYSRAFSYGTSFTYVQWEKEAIPPPMEWIREGKDDIGFDVFLPGEANIPYWRLKTCQKFRHGKSYEIHVFYFGSDNKLAHGRTENRE